MDVVMSASATIGIDVPKPAYHECGDCQTANGIKRGPKRGALFPQIDPELVPEFGRHICADIMHLRTTSVGGKRYALVIVDMHGRYPHVFPIARKDHAVEAMRRYCQRHLNGNLTSFEPSRAPQDPSDRGRPHTTLHCDNDSVFLGHKFEAVLDQYNCRIRTGRPNADNDNSICERMIRNLRGKMDTMLSSAGLRRELWVPALQWAAYLTALLPTTALDNVSPHHFLLGQIGLAEQAYVLARAVPFGTPTYAYNHGRSNNAPKKKLGIFIGINPVSLCPRILDAETTTVRETKDCTFVLETPFGHPYSMAHPTAYHRHGDPADGTDPEYYGDDTVLLDPAGDGTPAATSLHTSDDETGTDSVSSGGDTDIDTDTDTDSAPPSDGGNDPGPGTDPDSDIDLDMHHCLHATGVDLLPTFTTVDRDSTVQHCVNVIGVGLAPAEATDLEADVDRYSDHVLRHTAPPPPGLPTADLEDDNIIIGPAPDGFNTPGAAVTDLLGDATRVTANGTHSDDRDEPDPSLYPKSETEDGYADPDSRAFLMTVSTGVPPPPDATARPRSRVERRVVCGIPVVRDYDEARNSPHWESIWRPAFESECGNVRNRKIWKFFPRGTAAHRGHHKKIRVHLIWDIKRNDDGSFKKGKCRAVADGSQMVKGVHWTQSRSPVVRPALVRTIAAVAAAMGWRRRCGDVGSAYLWADLDTEVWASVPQSMLRPHERGKDVRIVKSQYGLVQAGLLWYVHLRCTMIANGYRPSDVDPCVYIKWTPKDGAAGTAATTNPGDSGGTNLGDRRDTEHGDNDTANATADAGHNYRNGAHATTADPLDPYDHGGPPSPPPTPTPTLATHHVSIVAVHVDDLFAVSSDDLIADPLEQNVPNQTVAVFDALDARYELTRDNEGTMYCGCRFIDHPDGSVTVDQNVFVQDLLTRADLGPRGTGPRVTSPFRSGTSLRPARTGEANDPANIEARTFPYRRHAASHLYHACMTRPADAYAAAKLCRYMSAHDHHHVAAMRNFTRYLRDNPERHPRYARPAHGPPVCLHAAADASLGDEHDGRTTIGFAIFVAGAAVEWKTGLARQLAVGTPHAEYIAASECARSTVVIATFLGGCGFPQGAVPLRIDNKPAKTLADSIAPTPLARYVAQRYHYLRHAVNVDKSIKLIGVTSKDQDADGLTKGLIGKAFRESTDRLTGVTPRLE